MPLSAKNYALPLASSHRTGNHLEARGLVEDGEELRGVVVAGGAERSGAERGGGLAAGRTEPKQVLLTNQRGIVSGYG